MTPSSISNLRDQATNAVRDPVADHALDVSRVAPRKHAPIDLHREAMERLAKPEPTRADLANERARCEAIVHSCDMADHPILSEVQESSRAARRIEEINRLIGKSNGTPEQLLHAVKIALEGLTINMRKYGVRTKDVHGRAAVIFEASIIDFGIGGMEKLIDRITRSQQEARS